MLFKAPIFLSLDFLADANGMMTAIDQAFAFFQQQKEGKNQGEICEIFKFRRC